MSTNSDYDENSFSDNINDIIIYSHRKDENDVIVIESNNDCFLKRNQNEISNDEIKESSNPSTDSEEIQINNSLCLPFSPRKSLLYIYFKESTHFTDFDFNHKEEFGLELSSDVQRNRYYPKTVDIFTFVGFNTFDDIRNALKSSNFWKTPERGVFHFYDFDYKDVWYFEFRPQNFYYVYLKDNLVHPCSSITTNKRFFKLKKSSEIQHFVFHPKTRELFTFVGFPSIDDIQTEIKNNQSFASRIFLYNISPTDLPDKIFHPHSNLYYIYYKNSDVTMFPKGNEILRKATDIQCGFHPTDPKEWYTFLGFKFIPDIVVIKNHLKTENGSESLGFYSFNCYKFGEELLNYNFFVPRNDLSYFYIVESDRPTDSTIITNPIQSEKLFGLQNIVEIHRGFYLPQDNSIYTFIGFSSNQQIYNAIHNKNFRQNHSEKLPFIYNFVDDDSLTVFEPTIIEESGKSAFYIYFNEISPPSASIKVFGNSNLFGVKNAVDFQRNFLSPKTRRAFTFIGFKTIDDVKAILENDRFRMNIISDIFFYNFVENDLPYKDFHPRKGLFYVFFEELDKTQLSQKRIEQKLRNANAVEVQHQMRLPYTTFVYTFVGFRKNHKRYKFMKQFRDIQEGKKTFYYIFDIPYPKPKPIELFAPIENLFYIQFHEIPQEKSTKCKDGQIFGLDMEVDIQRYVSSSQNQRSKKFTFVGFNCISSLRYALENNIFGPFTRHRIKYYNFYDDDLR